MCNSDILLNYRVVMRIQLREGISLREVAGSVDASLTIDIRQF